ncbi:MAG: flagellar hook-associated protein FlgK, partial [Oscillospiraceae bacterium]|nr:flagellar hook-associated protein FlgK [Oscillospiraceae bacterium]
MPLGFASYEISVSGLRANERSLFTVGHNITNAEVRGYSRQMSMHTTSFYAFAGRNAGLMQVGLGAGTQETRQIRNIFLDIVYRQENTHLGLWDVRNGTYQEVQAIVSDPIFQGLKDTMYNFWDSWHELSKDPASLSMRGVMLQRAEAMVDHMNHLGKQFDELQRNLNNEILVKVNQVNRITAEIAAINRAIARNEVVLGDHANDLRDKRNLLLDSLTRIADFDIEEKRDGMVQVTLGGYPLVYNDR